MNSFLMERESAGRDRVGTLKEYVTKTAAEKAVLGLQLAINANKPSELRAVTMKQLIQHFREKELVDKGEEGRAWSTRDRYKCYLRHWIEPRWGYAKLDDIKTPMVEEWLGNLQRQARKTAGIRPSQTAKAGPPLARATKAKIRNLMSVLFNHAIRWDFVARNPISGPNRGSGVRQSSKRMNVPDVLDVAEVQAIISKLQLRERVMLFLDMATGLRRGELCGIKWRDIEFENLLIDVRRSVVNQVVGRCKTETSQKPVPLDEYTLPATSSRWLKYTQYRDPEDWVFASNSNRAGSKRGKQPLWLSTVMRYHVQPVVRETWNQEASLVAYIPAHVFPLCSRQMAKT